MHEVENNLGKLEIVGVNSKETGSADTIDMVIIQFDNLELCVIDVKEVKYTDIIDQLMEQFEVDTRSKIYPGPGETLSEYLQKMCNFNPQTMLCPWCSAVVDSKKGSKGLQKF